MALFVVLVNAADRTGDFSSDEFAGVDSAGFGGASTLELDGRGGFCSARVLAAADRDDHQYQPAEPIKPRTKIQPSAELTLKRRSGKLARLRERTRSPSGRPAFGFSPLAFAAAGLGESGALFVRGWSMGKVTRSDAAGSTFLFWQLAGRYPGRFWRLTHSAGVAP